ncbi:MAG TPA: hypothetical protein VJ576_06750 [Rhodocyclaceae bacterium]|nr:hypothetical protein [Rhodocyclaceae bacterium]
MPIPFATAKLHAADLARHELCTTAELSAHALGCSIDASRSALKALADAGYLRPLLLPGLGTKVVYQPSAKLHSGPENIPKFLRAGLTPSGRWRGLLRAYVYYTTRPELAFLPTGEIAALCRCYGIQQRGYASALIGLDGPHSHVFVPMLHREQFIAAIEAAAFRWLPLLESGTATLHVVTPAPCQPEAQAALELLNPSRQTSNVTQDELAALKAEIESDPTGLTGLRLASRIEALESRAADIPLAANDCLPWLGSVIGASV